MSTYRNICSKCGDTTETESWEPESCPFCELEKANKLLNAYRKKRSFDGLNGRPWDSQKHLQAEDIISELEAL